MKAVVLGAAAGGGFPQWNSNAEACRRARAGDPHAVPRTQASLAVSGDGDRWFLINASPDLRQQIEARPILHPRGARRSSPIEGVILTGADVDAIAGLLHLRERQPFTLHASARVLEVLAANPIFGVLAADCVRRQEMPLGQPFELRHVDGSASGLSVELFEVPGKVALYLEAGHAPEDLSGMPGDTVLAGEARRADPVCALSPDHGVIEAARQEAERAPDPFVYRHYSPAATRSRPAR